MFSHGGYGEAMRDTKSVSLSAIGVPNFVIKTQD